METTRVFSKILDNSNNRIQVLQGGTSSSKTYSILQFLYLVALKSETPLIISVVSESVPHLKRGVIRDFINILGDKYIAKDHNKTDSLFKINKTIMEFFSADQPDKLQARRDILYINECNNIVKPSYDQLEVRTKRKVFLDFNPVQTFWVHEYLIGKPNVGFFISTYKDNHKLDGRIVQAIESRKDTDSNWWRVYGEGQVGKLEGLIYPDFEIINDMPEDIKLWFGLDFGFTNDPSALVEVGIQGDCIYLNELLYERFLTNDDIVKKFEEIGILKEDTTYGDNAEPKSIEEIYRRGYNIKPCIKGKDSINIGIDYIKRFKIKITGESVNLLKEIRNYSWSTDKNGNYLNKPEDGEDHLMDAIRYAITDKIQPLSVAHSGRMKF